MKISARDIQLFVAGAISVTGFHALYWLPHYLFTVHSGAQVFAHLVAGFTLPLGIGIFIGRARAVRLTEIYLWVMVVMGFISIPIFCYLFPAKAAQVIEG